MENGDVEERGPERGPETWTWGFKQDTWRHSWRNTWTWSTTHKSNEVVLLGPSHAQFNPIWSYGAAGVRTERPLERDRLTYWEVRMTDRLFGSSMMWGLCTADAALEIRSFSDLLGRDEKGWGLSHKGLLWHGGLWRRFTSSFRENVATVVGMLFDGVHGTLTYYKDGVCLGVAFEDLHLVKDPLFPAVCSTAGRTEMYLENPRREYASLQDRCREVILRNTTGPEDVLKLGLTHILQHYILHED